MLMLVVIILKIPKPLKTDCPSAFNEVFTTVISLIYGNDDSDSCAIYAIVLSWLATLVVATLVERLSNPKLSIAKHSKGKVQNHVGIYFLFFYFWSPVQFFWHYKKK